MQRPRHSLHPGTISAPARHHSTCKFQHHPNKNTNRVTVTNQSAIVISEEIAATMITGVNFQPNMADTAEEDIGHTHRGHILVGDMNAHYRMGGDKSTNRKDRRIADLLPRLGWVWLEDSRHAWEGRKGRDH